MKLFYLTILIINLTLPLAAQPANKAAGEFRNNAADSTSSITADGVQYREFKLSNPFYFDSPAYLQHEFLFSETYQNYDFSGGDFYTSGEENKPLLSYTPSNLSKALQLNYSFIKRNEPGTFGKILGGAVGISAIGLGIYHLIKYKDEYFK